MGSEREVIEYARGLGERLGPVFAEIIHGLQDDARSWEAKWLQERMNVKKSQEAFDECEAVLHSAQGALATKDAEVAALRQRVKDAVETLSEVTDEGHDDTPDMDDQTARDLANLLHRLRTP